MRDFFFKDFGWKLFSMLLAAFIWVTVHKIIEEPKAATVSAANSPVTYGNLQVALLAAAAADARQFRANSNTVVVTVSGPPEVMALLQGNQIHPLVDISDYNDDTKDVPRRVEVSVPWGVTVVNVEPAKLKIVPPPKP